MANYAQPFCYAKVRVKLYDLDPGHDSPEVVRAIIEIPKNSVNKYEYDGDLEMFRLDRALYSPMHYPGDYGFIPGTLADDGDPLDILVMVDEASFTGCLMEARPVGVLRMIDGKEHDEKILGIPRATRGLKTFTPWTKCFPMCGAKLNTSFRSTKNCKAQ